MPEARFLVVGPDSPIEPTLRGELTVAIEDKSLGGRVGLAGRLAADDLAATVAGASLLVHPAHREPFGLAVVEALTLGTPVVAYATAGPSEILRTGGGALVCVGDTGGLAKAVLRALDDPEVLGHWSAEAGTTARRFRLEATVTRYLDVLQGAAWSGRSSTKWSATTIGVAPPEASGVRDYGLLLGRELETRAFAIHQHWLENGGDRLLPALRVSTRLVTLALTLPAKGSVIWHYSPVAYGYRGIPGPGVVVGALLRARKCRVVSVLHELAYTYRPGLDPPRARVKALAQQLALRAVLAGSDEVVVTTDRRAAALAKGTAGRRAGVRVIPVFPTIPTEPLSRVTPEPTGRPLTLAVPGYAGDGVRADVLVEALSLIGPAEDVRVVLIGAPGAESPGGHRWSALASQHGVEHSLEFTGVVDPPEFSRRLAQSTVVVLVNEEGPSSRKTTLAAALAHGRPVVSLDGYNRWDQLIEAGAVWVVPCDPAALASSVARLRDSPVEREALGARGAAFAEAWMSLPRVADAFLELLTGASGQEDRPTGSAGAANLAAAAPFGLSSHHRRNQR
ncbi:MAG: glycosyltransferase family 4 protein [Acidimicrobiales bacterium]